MTFVLTSLSLYIFTMWKCIKVTEEPFYWCSTFHGHNSVFNNKVTTGSSVIRSVFHNLHWKHMRTWLTNYTVTCKIQFNFRSNHIPNVNTHEYYIIPDVNTHEYYIIPDVNTHEILYYPGCEHTWVLYYPECKHTWVLYYPWCEHTWVSYYPGCEHTWILHYHPIEINCKYIYHVVSLITRFVFNTNTC